MCGNSCNATTQICAWIIRAGKIHITPVFFLSLSWVSPHFSWNEKKINNAVNFAAVRISMSISVFSIKQVHSNSKLTCKSHFRKCLRLQRKKHLYAITNCNTKPWNATLFILKYVWAHGCIFVYLYMLRYDYNISHYSTFTICIGSISICPPKVALIVYKFNGNKS